MSALFPGSSLYKPGFELIIRQQPLQARLALANEKKRKPVDPPPIVQIRIQETGTHLAEHYLHSPYYFVYCSLHHATEDIPVPMPPSNALAGTLVSSLHRLKDVDDYEGGFFIFGDLSLKVEGKYRLKFTLFEKDDNAVTRLTSTISDQFKVSRPRSFPGMAESTFLSRLFADQGVKLKLRKESRKSIGKRSFAHTQHLSQPPDGFLPMPGNTTGEYAGADQDFGSYEGPVKRQCTSASFSHLDMFNNTQMGEYAQTMPAYPNQPTPTADPQYQTGPPAFYPNDGYQIANDATRRQF
ncbi:velvet factor-domain-containing protein [Aspergillus coremiiformis]|uniref:Velvet factor-domain-containing protein n=1 Tax=Aspergillus coremiiformis TaxID=138285 RepID=A0A5N6Z5M2_9EURO|nr:velvet factor-domain-containing protein [Aspergillus coremiiformis]